MCGTLLAQLLFQLNPFNSWQQLPENEDELSTRNGQSARGSQTDITESAMLAQDLQERKDEEALQKESLDRLEALCSEVLSKDRLQTLEELSSWLEESSGAVSNDSQKLANIGSEHGKWALRAEKGKETVEQVLFDKE